MIKKWSQFINESSTPSKNSEDSKCVSISKDDVELFSSEPILGGLISNEKVSLLDTEICYFSNDIETIKILNQYFPEKIEEMTNESNKNTIGTVKIEKTLSSLERIKKESEILIKSIDDIDESMYNDIEESLYHLNVCMDKCLTNQKKRGKQFLSDDDIDGIFNKLKDNEL